MLTSAMCRCAVGFALVAAISVPASAWASGRRGPASSNRGHDQQRRRQAAAELRRQGWEVDWRLASLAELRAWNLRAVEARGLRRYGIDADWRLFSSRQLEDLRLFLEFERDRDRAGAPVRPPVASERLRPPEVSRLDSRFDPDAILLPTYVVEGLANVDVDDGVLEATYALPRLKLRRAAAMPAAGDMAAALDDSDATAPDEKATGKIEKKKKPGKSRRASRQRPDI